jgi:sugar O-acyltransferase (sialic acid O-acetyltransferase NeuD family)
MKLLVAGAGGHGKVVADAAAMSGKYEVVAFLDDRYPGITAVGEWRVVGKLSDASSTVGEFGAFVAAFGDASLRLKALEMADSLGFSLAVVVHPSATLAGRVSLGAGTVVLAGAVVNIDAAVGRGCIINTGAVVEHDCRLDDGVHICPGASVAGEVRIGRCSWIGIGACVIQRITIGNDVTVGAGAACVRDVPDGRVVVGVPAKEIIS